MIGGGLQRATAWMAAGTGLSRLTGLLRVLVLAYALGATHLATSYNLANTTPNMIYDIVLGGVLSATFIPVFVDRLTTLGEREAWRAISAVVTLSAVVLVVMTVVFWFAAPDVIGAFTFLGHSSAAHPRALAEERGVATTLLRWFVPQVALYGFIALATSLLNARRRFVAPMWVPIANNLVCILVLLWFRHLTTAPSLAGVAAHPGWVVLLGLGTTLGVALQTLVLLMSLRGARLSRLRWRFDPRHEAVQTVMRLGGWTFGFVMANQVALFVVLALAVGAGGHDPVSSYTYAYTFLQMPYAVVAVSVMSAVTPALAERWALGDPAGFLRRLTGGLRAVLVIILPAAVGMLLLAHPAVDLLFAHGSYSVADAGGTGSALAMFALGLPGFCTYLYVVRVLQAMQRTKTAFWLYTVENGLNVILALALVHPMGVPGLALSLSVAYTVAAGFGLLVLRRWLGPLGDPQVWAPLRRAAVATAVMAVVVLLVSNLSAAQQGPLLLVRVLLAVAVGGLVYLGASNLLGRRAAAGAGPGATAGVGRDPTGPPEDRRLVARTKLGRAGAGTARTSDLRSWGDEAGGGEGVGFEYGLGIGPGTGMVPAVGRSSSVRSSSDRPSSVRLVGSSSWLGPVRPVPPPGGPGDPAGGPGDPAGKSRTRSPGAGGGARASGGPGSGFRPGSGLGPIRPIASSSAGPDRKGPGEPGSGRGHTGPGERTPDSPHGGETGEGSSRSMPGGDEPD